MDRGSHIRRRERASASLEYVGIMIAVAVLLGTAATGMATAGRSLGGTVAERVQAVVGEPREARAVTGVARRRAARERRWSGGRVPERVSRDELRLSPLLGPYAAWERRWRIERTVAGTAARVDVRACALCAALEWSHELGSGARVDGDGSHTGIESTVTGTARVALASIEASFRANRSFGPVDASAQGRVRGTVGAEADAEARVRLSRRAQDVQLHGSAMAGAVVRAEGRVGVDLLGIAIRNGGSAEGWAGAGARGTVGMRREGERLDWRVGWGAAVGLGGAAEWRGSIDVSGVPERHRTLARATLDAAVRAALSPIPTLSIPTLLTTP